MKVIDSHVHLYPKPILEKEMKVSKENVNELLNQLSQKVKQNSIEKALVYILDEKALSMNMNVPENLIISTIVGVHNTYIRDLEKAFHKGIKIIKILPYEQKITREEYPYVLEIAKSAKEKEMLLTICSTYGSKLIYDTNGIELAAFIKKKVDIPIILAHGGGPKIFDAMSLALEYEDIFLDLSFSIKYWWGSSVIDDYAFALKKLGSKRIFYGSDYPYINFDESLGYLLRFIKKYKFSENDKNNMLYYNFEKFKERYLL